MSERNRQLRILKIAIPVIIWVDLRVGRRSSQKRSPAYKATVSFVFGAIVILLFIVDFTGIK